MVLPKQVAESWLALQTVHYAQIWLFDSQMVLSERMADRRLELQALHDPQTVLPGRVVGCRLALQTLLENSDNWTRRSRVWHLRQPRARLQ